jgi:hypothetical protein
MLAAIEHAYREGNAKVEAEGVSIYPNRSDALLWELSGWLSLYDGRQCSPQYLKQMTSHGLVRTWSAFDREMRVKSAKDRQTKT